MPWLIDLKDKEVIVIGGGKAAKQKIIQFIDEGAKVTVVALNILDSIKQLSCHSIESAYDIQYLNGAFLVYSATNDHTLNQRIVDDANKQGILSASATRNKAILKSMKKIKTNNMILGVSTGYPAFSKKLKEELIIYDEYLIWLKKIRDFVLEKNLVDYIERKSFFNNMLLFSENELALIYDFLIKNKGKIMVFSVHLDSLTNNITKLLNALSISYYDQNYSDKINALISLKICWKIQPMVISYGKVYDKILTSINYHMIEKPLFINNEILDKLYYSDEKRLFLIHPRCNDDLRLLLQDYGWVHEFNQPLSNRNSFDQIIPFVLTKGYHYKNHIIEIVKDLNIDSSHVLLEDEIVVKYLVELIKSRFK